MTPCSESGKTEVLLPSNRWRQATFPAGRRCHVCRQYKVLVKVVSPSWSSLHSWYAQCKAWKDTAVLIFFVTCEWQYACLDPLHCSCLQVLVAAGDSVWVVDADAAVDQGLTAGPLTRLAASPDGRFVAGFSASGRVLGSRSSCTAHRF